jgi:hypothetical protein
MKLDSFHAHKTLEQIYYYIMSTVLKLLNPRIYCKTGIRKTEEKRVKCQAAESQREREIETGRMNKNI